MSNNKDYCDYELRLGLRDIGYPMSTCQINDGPIQMPKITLYEAQKWLREEKKIIIEATFNLMYKGQPRFGWRVLYNLTQHKGSYYTFDSVKSKEDYDSYEEALSEGVKCAVKILKEK